MPKPKEPRDLNQGAKLVVSMATGQPDVPTVPKPQVPVAVELVRIGELKAKSARAQRLSVLKRRRIARRAAQARWITE